jgi:site-specific DNA-methyltransferase (adenine-specific)
VISQETEFPKTDAQNSVALLDKVLIGDSWTLAKCLPSNSVQSIITSPPYFGHRKYAQSLELSELEFGQEKEPGLYVEKLTALFAELRRVLQPHGTLWLNLGDTYRDGRLLGIPWRVALALQDHGWILRSEIIWNKPNAMPSSVKNRPTTSHEHIFLLSQAEQYFYDADAIREPHITFSDQSKMKGGRSHLGKRNGTPENGKNKGNPNLHNGRWDQAFHPAGRNKRTVWEISLGKFRDVHFAVFPEELAETCILAGSAKGDTILDPFMGSGTTAIVASRLGRHFLGLELIPEYANMTMSRVQQVQKMLL